MTSMAMPTAHSQAGTPRLRVVAGKRQAMGRTMGEAVDALTAEERRKLQALIDAELDATIARTAGLTEDARHRVDATPSSARRGASGFRLASGLQQAV